MWFFGTDCKGGGGGGAGTLIAGRPISIVDNLYGRCLFWRGCAGGSSPLSSSPSSLPLNSITARSPGVFRALEVLFLVDNLKELEGRFCEFEDVRLVLLLLFLATTVPLVLNPSEILALLRATART